MKNSKIRGRLLATVLISVLMLAGCGSASLPESVEQTSLEVSSKGKVISWLVSDFDKDYYNVSELAEMATKEAEAYNAAHLLEGGEKAIEVGLTEEFAGGSKVRLAITYADYSTYADYNDEILFYGTVADAVLQGYDFNTQVKSVSDEEELTGTDIKLDGSKYVLITNAKANVYCPRKITHIDYQTALNEDGSVDTTHADAVVYILMK